MNAAMIKLSRRENKRKLEPLEKLSILAAIRQKAIFTSV
jgi:hypothetical protein